MPFYQAYKLMRVFEGGLVTGAEAARRGDPGGRTSRGITEATLRRMGIDRDPAALSEREVRDLYHLHYWLPVKPLAIVSEAVALAVFDFGVQSGPGRAIKTLQRIIGVAPDGIVGPKTTQRLSTTGELSVLFRLCRERREFLVRWVLHKPRRLTLIRGLMVRVDRVLYAATQTAIRERPTQPADALWRGYHVTRT